MSTCLESSDQHQEKLKLELGEHSLTLGRDKAFRPWQSVLLTRWENRCILGRDLGKIRPWEKGLAPWEYGHAPWENGLAPWESWNNFPSFPSLPKFSKVLSSVFSPFPRRHGSLVNARPPPPTLLIHTLIHHAFCVVMPRRVNF